MRTAEGLANIECLVPDWPAPERVKAAFTLRSGGVSAPPFDTLNLGMYVGDAPEAVTENRRRLCAQLRLPEEPAWLKQVHGTIVADLSAAGAAAAPADAVISRHPGPVCAVQVADCLPVLLSARDGSAIAAVHAGWRGLASGVLEATLGKLGIEPGNLLAWLGPAIGIERFEVGSEVRDAFLAHDASADAAFVANSRGRWQCDLAVLARQRLARCDVAAIYGGQWCTYSDARRFFSYRRDGVCGRMAALVWLI